MLKNQEFKSYGSIRKMKSGGACGVILQCWEWLSLQL